jgi:hypothetical protein
MDGNGSGLVQWKALVLTELNLVVLQPKIDQIK